MVQPWKMQLLTKQILQLAIQAAVAQDTTWLLPTGKGHRQPTWVLILWVLRVKSINSVACGLRSLGALSLDFVCWTQQGHSFGRSWHHCKGGRQGNWSDWSKSRNKGTRGNWRRNRRNRRNRRSRWSRKRDGRSWSWWSTWRESTSTSSRTCMSKPLLFSGISVCAITNIVTFKAASRLHSEQIVFFLKHSLGLGPAGCIFSRVSLAGPPGHCGWEPSHSALVSSPW